MDQFAYQRLVQRIQDDQNKAVLVIIVNQDDTIDTAGVGMDTQGMMFITFDVARQCADELYAQMTPKQQRGLVIALPTLEEAKRLGILRPRKGK